MFWALRFWKRFSMKVVLRTSASLSGRKVHRKVSNGPLMSWATCTGSEVAYTFGITSLIKTIMKATTSTWMATTA